MLVYCGSTTLCHQACKDPTHTNTIVAAFGDPNADPPPPCALTTALPPLPPRPPPSAAPSRRPPLPAAPFGAADNTNSSVNMSTKVKGGAGIDVDASVGGGTAATGISHTVPLNGGGSSTLGIEVVGGGKPVVNLVHRWVGVVGGLSGRSGHCVLGAGHGRSFVA